MLIVEDEPDLAEVHRRATHKIGLEPTVVESAAAAEQLASAGSFDLIIMDLKLPDGNGLDTCERIWRRNPDQRILVVSGSAYDEDERLSNAAAVILKPYRLELLVRAVKDLLIQPSGTRLGILNPILGNQY